MAYRLLRDDRDLTRSLRRIAAEQIEAAIAETSRPPEQAEKAVHDIRKHCKKLRGLMRLMRPGFGDYAQENAAARDIARMSSSLRDAEVLRATHDTLVRTAGADPATGAAVRAALVLTRPESPEMAEDALPRQRAELEAMLKRSGHWTVSGKPRKVLHKGLSRSWLRAAAALESTRTAPTAESFHLARKRIKDHWYHSRLMQPVQPRLIRGHRDVAKALSELLGDHHDLAVYLAALAAMDLPEPALRPMRALALTRQSALARQIWTAADALFIEPPEALPDRWIRWYGHWRGN